MAFSSTNGSKRLVSEINVTPLVDVMLVLLIIFMVTAPMMTQGVDVDRLRRQPNPYGRRKTRFLSRSRRMARYTLTRSNWIRPCLNSS